MPDLGRLERQDDALRDALQRSTEWMVRYLERLDSLPVLPQVQPGDVRHALPQSPPEQGEDLATILSDIDRVVVPATTHWNHPGFLAYFASSASTAGIAGEMLGAAFNVNAMLWRTSPAATELEQLAVDWLRQLLGLPAGLFGFITDTASTSTLTALAAAREAQADLGIRERGMSGRSDLPLLTVYASQEAHSSVEKALIALGIGRLGMRRIAVDDELRMRADELERAITADVAAGHRPMAVVATAGTTSTTSVDPVAAIARVCARHDVWLHVDAAYGGAAAIVPELRWVLDGCDAADSIVVNPHKWLFTPLDCSVLWTRHPATLRSAFSLVPEYLRSDDDGDAPNLMDYGVALGRRFRALKLWMVLRHLGAEGLRARIREHCAMARTLADRVRASDSFELLAPVPLSVVCLRAHPQGVDAAELDSLNEELLRRINARGSFFLSHTRVRDAYAIRVAFGNVRTTQAHAQAVWDELADELARLA